MKKFIGYILLTLVLVSCEIDNGFFRIEGRFKNFNQGEFFIYSMDGGIYDLDTIKVFDGRFSYETPLNRKATFTLVFPNYSQQVVFGEPGATAKINADASHLKGMKITGTDENELLTDFRMDVIDMTPPEALKAVEAFVKENPKSMSALYLINKYFVQTNEPNFQKAYLLTGEMVKADSTNVQALILHNKLNELKNTELNCVVPEFSVKDIDGKNVTQDSLKAKINIISTWATWSYNSQNFQKNLRKLQKKHGDDIQMLSICLDARVAECRERSNRDSMLWYNVCDGNMWNTPIVKQLGLSVLPACVVFDEKGKIIGRDFIVKDLNDKVKSVLEK